MEKINISGRGGARTFFYLHFVNIFCVVFPPLQVKKWRTHIVQDLRCQLSHLRRVRAHNLFYLPHEHNICVVHIFHLVFKKNAQDLRKWVRAKDDDDLNTIKIKRILASTPK